MCFIVVVLPLSGMSVKWKCYNNNALVRQNTSTLMWLKSVFQQGT